MAAGLLQRGDQAGGRVHRLLELGEGRHRGLVVTGGVRPDVDLRLGVVDDRGQVVRLVVRRPVGDLAPFRREVARHRDRPGVVLGVLDGQHRRAEAARAVADGDPGVGGGLGAQVGHRPGADIGVDVRLPQALVGPGAEVGAFGVEGAGEGRGDDHDRLPQPLVALHRGDHAADVEVVLVRQGAARAAGEAEDHRVEAVRVGLVRRRQPDQGGLGDA
ncbi:hypothetical protein SDC9_70890 [bioreactor metagenome]|uniref:Uncharacterized protein n=1 Tax=bioreactor metagenome TaxID=1076179 RepID=A0A644Y902_9ZZZZ